jgi:hypothetical protein
VFSPLSLASFCHQVNNFLSSSHHTNTMKFAALTAAALVSTTSAFAPMVRASSVTFTMVNAEFEED